MDLSGTGAFGGDDTIEVEGLTTDDDRILFASPLTQMLSDGNTSHRLAVRMRRESDRAFGQSGANVCLYYSLDFFQANGTCRQNYAKVRFNGRETCRWAALGASNRHWYTLYKPPGDKPQGPGPRGGYSVGFGQTTVMVPEGQVATGFQVTSIPEPPDVTGLDGCRGNRDSRGNQDGLRVCVYSTGTIGFRTYAAGTLHGPYGEYNANGQRHGDFGSYTNGVRTGTWTYYRNGERVHDRILTRRRLA